MSMTLYMMPRKQNQPTKKIVHSILTKVSLIIGERKLFTKKQLISEVGFACDLYQEENSPHIF